MARINIEDSLFKEKAFEKLILRLGSRRAAIGALVEAFMLAQKHYLTTVNGRSTTVNGSERNVNGRIRKYGVDLIKKEKTPKRSCLLEVFNRMFNCKKKQLPGTDYIFLLGSQFLSKKVFLKGLVRGLANAHWIAL